MRIFYKNEIEKALDIPSILEAIEEGFVIYSKKEAVIGQVASLGFTEPPGECHIKYGYARKGKYYVIKAASGFYENQQLGLPFGNGVMLLFDKKTGAFLCVLADEGYLTDIRTAAAGSIAAKYLAPKHVERIGIVGTGTQAYFQLKLLKYATNCRKVFVWGRHISKAQKFCALTDWKDFEISVAQDLDQLTSSCNLIVTTTPASKALLFARQIAKGVHITAVGADDHGKQEIDPFIFAKADRIAVDSKSQCSQFGDSFYALKQGIIEESQLVELGEIIQNPALCRRSDEEISLADLTGVAIQDLQIASSVYENLIKGS